jgi:hypothetical protein
MNSIWIKYLSAWFAALAAIYLIADFVFFRGLYIETQIATVQSVSTSIPRPGGAGPVLKYAYVQLENDQVVQAVCEPSCHIGTEIEVHFYEPLIGWNTNYYATGVQIKDRP